MLLDMRRANVAERERGTGSRASRRRWRTVDAECTVARHREHRRATKTHSDMIATLVSRLERRKLSVMLAAMRRLAAKASD